jgi:hypothetical protein
MQVPMWVCFFEAVVTVFGYKHQGRLVVAGIIRKFLERRSLLRFTSVFYSCRAPKGAGRTSARVR